MKKLKVRPAVGTRPEIIRLSRVMAQLDVHCDHVLVHTEQNYDHEHNKDFFDDLGVNKPDHFFNAASAGPSETIGDIIGAVDKVLVEEEPEATLVPGNTNSCLSVNIAKRRKGPVFHMEACDRCFHQRVPEEINRCVVDHFADFNLTCSSIACRYLLRERLPPDTVLKTGSPMLEVLHQYADLIDASGALQRLGLAENRYFSVSAHYEEKIGSDRNFGRLVGILNRAAEDHVLPAIVSTRLRTMKYVQARGSTSRDFMHMLKPLAFHDHVQLQKSTRAVMSDNGAINNELFILNLHARNLREAHERPEGMEEVALILVGLSQDRVRQSLKIRPRGDERGLRLIADYSVPNVSEKVVRTIHNYTDYVYRIIKGPGAGVVSHQAMARPSPRWGRQRKGLGSRRVRLDALARRIDIEDAKGRRRVSES